MKRFINIGAKAAAVVAGSLGILSQSQAIMTEAAQGRNTIEPALQRYRNRLTPRLVLKLNLYRPGESRLVSHSSHSSHESHASHSSHSSGGYGNDGGGGAGLGVLAVGGVVVYGLYRAAKGNKK